MENELIIQKNWLQKNWITLIVSFFLVLIVVAVVLNSNSKNGVTDTLTALKENALYEKAIDLANSNSTVLETIGKIDSIDKLAILEGNTSYTNNKKDIVVSVRINGIKKQGKIEIQASKNGAEWIYKKIIVRTKNSNKEIIVLDKP